MKVKSESEVAQSCPTLCDPMDCRLPGSSVRGFSRQEYWSGVPWGCKESDSTEHLNQPKPMGLLLGRGFHQEGLGQWGPRRDTAVLNHVVDH